MDIYGIGASLSAHIKRYIETHRGTGRTSTLLSILREGDAVVFSLPSAKSHFERQLKEAGFKNGDVKVITASPRYPSDAIDKLKGRLEGKVYFDHTYLEEFFTQANLDARVHIMTISRELSGFGERHRKTKAAAEKLHHKGFR